MSYKLHSICVHDGGAMSGHYYTLIYDWSQKLWWKFNDIKVSQIKEEDVFKVSNGGSNSWQSAFLAVYVNHDIFTQLNNVKVNSYMES
jgi:ubiquitin carboxyl-terminal hydrolase 25/28